MPMYALLPTRAQPGDKRSFSLLGRVTPRKPKILTLNILIIHIIVHMQPTSQDSSPTELSAFRLL